MLIFIGTVCGCGLDARLFRGSREIGEVQGASGCGDRSLGHSTAQQSAKKLGMCGKWLVNLFGGLVPEAKRQKWVSSTVSLPTKAKIPSRKDERTA